MSYRNASSRAAAGCLDWQRQRLNPPEIVLAATNEYLKDEDTLGMWLAECCLVRADSDERTSYLYESFRRWKQDRGESPDGQKRFTGKLTERGFLRDRDKYGWKMCGLHLEGEERKIVESTINRKRAAEGKEEWWDR